MLLHLFIGDGQLIKPPEDLLSLSLVITTAGGYGKGGREFVCGSNWNAGTFLRFHHTVICGDIDDPACKKISVELKGCYKKAPAKEVSVAIASFETNPKQKARSLTLEMAAYTKEAAGDKYTTVNALCKLSVTLFHNQFPIDLSPDEVALKHKRELIADKEKKAVAAGPPPHEYSFLLTRKINWPAKKPASFNKGTEHLLDEDVYKNLKSFQKNKKSTKEYRQRRRFMKNKFNQNQPQLAYIARAKYATPAQGLMPYRVTTLGVGFVGERINPTAARAKAALIAQISNKAAKIPFSQKARARSTAQTRRGKGQGKFDPLDNLYNRMLSAEERRIKNIRKAKREARERVNQDRVRAKIIALKKAEQEAQDEHMRAMVHNSDSQLKSLRNEINRRKRRIAFLGLQKHLSESDARAKAAEEVLLNERKEARLVLEREAAEALAQAHRARSPQRVSSSKMNPAGPKNAIPLRRAPDSISVKKRKAVVEASVRAAERARLEAEAKAALKRTHAREVKHSKPMPVEGNRIPLRSVNLAAIKSQREKIAEVEASERRSMAIAAAMEAEALMREKHLREAPPPVTGVIYSNPYPVRKVNTVSQEPAAESQPRSPPKAVYDFARIEKQAEANVNDESSESIPYSEKAAPFTYTLKTGTVLRARSLKGLQAQIVAASRTFEAKKVTEKQQKRALGMTAVSDKAKDSRAPVQKKTDAWTKQAINDAESDNEEAVIEKFSKAIGEFTSKAEENWLEASKSSVEILTSRSTEVLATSQKVDALSAKMSKDDALLRGDGSTQGATTTAGFLSTYNTVGVKAAGGSGGKKTSKKDEKKAAKAAAAAEVDELVAGIEKMSASPPIEKTEQEQEDEDLELLKRQLQAQGVTVDEKMQEVMQSLRK